MFAVEVTGGEPFTRATPAALAAAAELQPQLTGWPDTELLKGWAKGDVLDFGFSGGGSQWRLAVADFAGPAGGRGVRRPGMTLREARAATALLTPAQLAAVASRVMAVKGTWDGGILRGRRRRRGAAAAAARGAGGSSWGSARGEFHSHSSPLPHPLFAPPPPPHFPPCPPPAPAPPFFRHQGR